MTRSRIALALIAAATLTLSACSSGGDSPADDAASGQQQSANQTDTGAAGDDDAADSAPTGAGDADTTGDAPTAASPDSDGDGTDGATGATTPTTTETISGSLDAQSKAWFGTFCGGVTPILTSGLSMVTAGMGGAGDDPAKAKQTMVAGLNSMADSLSDLGSELQGQQPPTIEHGDQIAAQIAAGITDAAPKLRQAAQQLDATTVSTSDELNAAMDKVSDVMADGMDAIGAQGYELSDSLQQELQTLPACAPLYSFGQSLDASPTS